jgi:hypothetical protein
MSDSEALKPFDGDLLLEAIIRGDWPAVKYIAPWALLELAIRSECFSRESRMELLAVAFSWFCEMPSLFKSNDFLSVGGRVLRLFPLWMKTMQDGEQICASHCSTRCKTFPNVLFSTDLVRTQSNVTLEWCGLSCAAKLNGDFGKAPKPTVH